MEYTNSVYPQAKEWGRSFLPNPKVTVLMSVYNGERYIDEAINSILTQTFTDFEFLIINDSSTDTTSDIIQGYNDPRIKIITNEENLGLTKSLNIGLRKAKGKYIARMDADDISFPCRLEVQYSFMQTHNDVGATFGWVEVINENGETIRLNNSRHSPEEIYYILNFRNCLAHSTAMISREIIEKVGGYNELIITAQDYELWNRISKKSKIVKINQYLVKWREHNKSISSNHSNSQFNSIYYIFCNQFFNKNKSLFSENQLKFLSKNIESKNYSSANNLSMYEHYSAFNVLFELKQAIVNNTPIFFPKSKIKKISENHLFHVLIVICLKYGLISGIRLISINENIKYQRKLIFGIYIVYFFTINKLKDGKFFPQITK